MELREHDYIDGVCERVEALCNSGVWAGVQSGQCSAWLDQFRNAGAELLGACLLDNLMYRSEHQTLALLKRALCDSRLLLGDDTSDGALLTRLRASPDPGVRLVPVVSAERPTKSGAVMLRWIERKLDVRHRSVSTSELRALPSSVRTLIAVDDFCGSGKQFVDTFLRCTEVESVLRARDDLKLIYVVAAAHASGIARIAREAPSVAVVAGEVLSERDHFFRGTLLDRHYIPDLASRLKVTYDALASDHGFGGRLGPLGFADQALTYAFSHATPNNTLPIYWHTSEHWKPLLTR